MPEFEQVRASLKEARNQGEAARDQLSAALERLKKIEAEAARLARVADPRNARQERERERLASARVEAERQAKRSREEAARWSGIEGALIESFTAFSDPRQNVGRLSDAFPLLLLPVRLETRFKTIGEGSAARNQLWVRIYPDDCAIDTFEAVLSESEVRNARAFWLEVWRAGGASDGERAAWRGLVGSHGSGRAAYIVGQYQPVNLANKPAKVSADDIVLVIPHETALNSSERDAVAAYWSGVWLAGDDRAAVEAAFAKLRADTSDARATELEAQYRPFNLGDQPRKPLAKSEVKVSTEFIIFPQNTPAKRASWTRAPRTSVLPDRFVLICYSGQTTFDFVGNPIPSPLVVGPDPEAAPATRLRSENGELKLPGELRWTADFDRAVEWGLGFRIDLTEAQARRGFDRILAVGVRLTAGAEDAKALLEDLLRHHQSSRGGCSVLPQGTATNNVEGAGSGLSSADDADASFDDLQRGALFTETDDPLRKSDGQWLAELLGLDPAVFKTMRHSGGSDQSEARAMNHALWPATIGYMMDTLMQPVFSAQDIAHTRWFFTEFVSGRGAAPSIRIGRQPYGILVTTAFSRINWLRRNGETAERASFPARLAFLRRLRELLVAIESDWAQMQGSVSFVGKSGDAHKLLLDIIGLHPASVEFHSRFAESIEQLFNELNLGGLGGALLAGIIAGGYVQSGMQLLQRLGYSGQAAPEVLKKFFYAGQDHLKGAVVDDVPLSETAAIRPYTADGRNYIRWLLDSARTSLDAVRTEQGFKDNKTPSALLYLMLRHALLLGYHDTVYQLYAVAGFLPAAELSAMKAEPAFIHVKQDAPKSESRWEQLYRIDPRITQSATATVAQYIATVLGTPPAAGLADQLGALGVLENAPTARLERAFADHIDCCTYRFDAWLLGLVQFQLQQMRYAREGDHIEKRQGIYLGAYGWLEDVRREQKQLTPVELDEELEGIFGTDPPLVSDRSNGGYIHAPSPNHAVTAAVLRNGYISNATPANPDTLAVNLSSERVRLALATLEGMRNGQSLGALLGYQLERGLHDRYALAEVDRFIYALRKAFPLRANRILRTRVAADSIEAIEARNVLDGVRLVEHIKRTGNANYPFDISTLPQADGAAAAINAEVARILDINDAVADVALAESVHQAVQGNYDRVAATLETYTKGNYPPDPDVVRTPASGAGLTHRVGLHLDVGAAVPVNATPRAAADPALNEWLGGILPPLNTIGAQVVWKNPATDAAEDATVTMAALGLQPIDLLYLIRTESEQAMSELDDRILRHVITNTAPRPDAALSILYMNAGTAALSVFEVAPLVSGLRTLALRTRPLRASDILLPNEAAQERDQDVFADRARVQDVHTSLGALDGRLANYLNVLDPFLADTTAHRDDLLDGIDAFISDAASRLSEAASFGIAQTGWGLAFDWKRTQFAAVLEKVRALVARWTANLAEFDARIAEFDALPIGTPSEVGRAILHTAERFISTSYTPVPTKAALLAKRAAFVTRRDQFAALLAGGGVSLANLLAAVGALLPVDQFDSAPFSIADVEDRVVAFAAELASLIRPVRTEVGKRAAAAQTKLTEHDAAASASGRVRALEQGAKALLGEDFRIIPQFSLTAAQGDEWQNALAAATQTALFQHFAGMGIDFPIDEWLHGAARVRANLHAWEEVLLLAGAFGRPEPALTAAQFPVKAGEPWLALEFPAGSVPDCDRVLYTAHYATAFDKSRRQCGLLLDEWTEVVHFADPDLGVSTHDTALAFHYDRPNSEPPQTMLLVTPATWDGQWQWADIVEALNETLELAKKRAVEPVHLDATAYARFLPATVMAVALHGIAIATALAANNEALMGIHE